MTIGSFSLNHINKNNLRTGEETTGLGGDRSFSTDFATNYSEKVFSRLSLMSAPN